jgi:hypothetical protein
MGDCAALSAICGRKRLMMNDEPIILSEEGRLRQQLILQAALGASRGRKRRRIVIRSIWQGVSVIVLAALLRPWIYFKPPAIQVAQPIVIEHPVEHPAPLVIVQRIETDPNILARLALPPMRSHVRHISEDELLRELADAHQPAGVISVDGKARLVFR